MLIDVMPDEKDGIHYTVHVPVGTDKLMMTAARDRSHEGLQGTLSVGRLLIWRCIRDKDGETTRS
jgi:hypothetical protein